MCSVAVIVLHLFAQTQAKALTANHRAGVQDFVAETVEKSADESVDWADKLVDKLVNKLSDRVLKAMLKVSACHHADLESTTLRKPGYLAIPPRTTLASLAPCRDRASPVSSPRQTKVVLPASLDHQPRQPSRPVRLQSHPALDHQPGKSTRPVRLQSHSPLVAILASADLPYHDLHTHSLLPGVSTLPKSIYPNSAWQPLSQGENAIRYNGTTKETHMRSAAKALSWQIIDCSVTAIASYVFTSSLVFAGAMASFHMFSDSILLYLHERIWNVFDWGRSNGVDTVKRSTAKTISANTLENLTTLIGATLLNFGNMHLAGQIAIVDFIAKFVLYWVYERVWAVIKWGVVLQEKPRELQNSTRLTPSLDSMLLRRRYSEALLRHLTLRGVGHWNPKLSTASN